jgi:CRP-like cAMP-binding protein
MTLTADRYPNFYHYLGQNTGSGLLTEMPLLAPYVSPKTYAKGTIILQKGQVSPYAYFVEKGLLRLYALDAQGKEHILQFAPEFWWLSDRNNLCNQVASDYYVDALEDTTVLLINHDFIVQACQISPTFRQFHEDLLQRHINQLYKRILLLIGTTAKERYLDFLTRYPDLTQRVPQWMIASYLGITPEGLSRVRRGMSQN